MVTSIASQGQPPGDAAFAAVLDAGFQTSCWIVFLARYCGMVADMHGDVLFWNVCDVGSEIVGGVVRALLFEMPC